MYGRGVSCPHSNKNPIDMEDIRQWLNDPARDYAAGVELFARYSPNRMLTRYFQTGTPRFRMDKLIYEMGKMAKSRTVKPHALVETMCTSSLPIPDFIAAAKKEISALYSLIDRMHGELYDTGETNDPAAVRKRKRILDKRRPAIERADRLYTLKEEWFAGNAAVEKEIREMLSAPLKEQPTLNAATRRNQNAETMCTSSLQSDIELAKMKTRLRTTITKTRNMLQYQSIRKGDAPATMPDGPKRDEYEKKLKALEKELKAVCAELERRAAK